MASKQVIALYSPVPQSGKSTVATMIHRILRERHPTIIHSFASPIKKMVGALLSEMGYTNMYEKDRYIYGDLKEAPLELYDNNTTARELMQTLGTEWGRETVNERLWIDILLNKIVISPAHTIIIDDMRFSNEKLALESLEYANINVFCYKVIRPTAEEYIPRHISEGSLDTVQFDDVINNSGSLEDLEREVKRVLRIA